MTRTFISSTIFLLPYSSISHAKPLLSLYVMNLLYLDTFNLTVNLTAISQDGGTDQDGGTEQDGGTRKLFTGCIKKIKEDEDHVSTFIPQQQKLIKTSPLKCCCMLKKQKYTHKRIWIQTLCYYL